MNECIYLSIYDDCNSGNVEWLTDFVKLRDGMTSKFKKWRYWRKIGSHFRGNSSRSK